jgi:hypothetical protein
MSFAMSLLSATFSPMLSAGQSLVLCDKELHAGISSWRVWSWSGGGIER